MPTMLEAPIVAVTVYPRHARITRRGRVRLGGDDRFTLGGLPLGLAPESVRVTGSGPATIVGVDVAPEVHARADDPVLAELRATERAAQARLDEAVDAETVAGTRASLLDALARRSGTSLAKALATGDAAPSRVADVGDALAAQLTTVLARQRELAERHAELADELAAATRAVEQRAGAGDPDRNAVTVELAGAEGEAELEVSYVVTDAGWQSGYDIRVRGEELALTWYGLVTQRTGEDWPECELALSTARPAATVAVPELSPWFLDRVKEPPPAVPQARAGGVQHFAAAAAVDERAEFAASTAEVEHGTAAATYRPRRPVAVPSDGSTHRTTIAQLDLTARLDHVTAPVRDEHAYLRAVATNDSEHTLRPGRAAIFHGTEFVGSTRLDPWAPGEEVELALGIDERIRVERELVRRTATKGRPGLRRREAGYRITVGNHGPSPTTVTLLDQAPVSRDEGITVRDARCAPEPAERGDLGELTWRLELEPGASAEVTVDFRVDIGKGVDVAGWRE